MSCRLFASVSFSHDNLPKELLLSWTPEQLAYLRDIAYWTETMNSSRDAEVISIYEMESNENVWVDWLNQEGNEIAVHCRKTMDAGGGIGGLYSFGDHDHHGICHCGHYHEF